MIKKLFRFYSLPMYILVRPIDGFHTMKFEGKGTIKLALFNFFLLCLAYAFNSQYTGILVYAQNPLALNTLRDALILFMVVALFCISNWSVTSLTDGEGRFKDIVMAICYAMTPLIFAVFFATILSRYLAYEETGFYHMIMSVGVAYFALLLFIGLVVVHNYTVAKTFLTIFFTFIALLIIVFLITLLFTFWQQLIVFATSLHTEIMFRGR